jgi:hypothetical protein
VSLHVIEELWDTICDEDGSMSEEEECDVVVRTAQFNIILSETVGPYHEDES